MSNEYLHLFHRVFPILKKGKKTIIVYTSKKCAPEIFFSPSTLFFLFSEGSTPQQDSATRGITQCYS